MSTDIITAVLSRLKAQPSTDQLRSALFKIDTIISKQKGRAKDLNQLASSNIILEYTIPETYLLLDDGAKQNIFSILSNRICLYQLIVKISADPNNDVYIKVLVDLVYSRQFVDIFSDLNNQSLQSFRELEKLVTFKIPETLNKCYLQHKTKELETITVKYYNIIFSSVLKEVHDHDVTTLSRSARILDSLYLADPKLINSFFHDINIHRMLCDVYNQISTDWRFVKVLISYMANHLDDSDLSIRAYYFILDDLSFNQRSTLLEYARSIGHLPSSKVILALSFKSSEASDNQCTFYNFLLECTVQFGSKSYIAETPTATQQFFTRFIICLAQYCTREQLNSFSCDSSFICAISNRLDSPLNITRELGMCFADFIYGRIKKDGSVLFDIVELQIREKAIFSACEPINIRTNGRIHNSHEAISYLQNRKMTTDGTICKRVVSLNHPEGKSSDIRSKVDNIHKDNTVSIPVYLKELSSYMNADQQTDKFAYEKMDVAFAIAPQMIRSKANTPELRFYSTSILQDVISMSNSADNDDFNTWKLSTMIALNVGDFDNCSTASVKAFLNSDISMSSRLMILTSLSLSCRELSGKYNDNFVEGKDGIEKFTPKKLPESLHRQFMQYESSDSPFLETPDKLLALNSDMKALRVDGQVVRVSSTLKKKLSKPETKNCVAGDKKKNTVFINKKLPQLFYSLAGVWKVINGFTGRGFKLGTFSAILNSEYFHNLRLIYECAIPSSIELPEMTKDLLLLLSNELKQIAFNKKINQNELLHLFDCVLEVLDIDDSVVPLTGLFMNILYDIYGTLGQLIENDLVVDEQCQGKCANIIKKLRNLIF